MTDNELIRMLRTCPYTECPNCEVRAVCDNFDNNNGNGRLDAFIADRLEALLDEVERLKDQLPKWVSVTERLPEMRVERYEDGVGTVEYEISDYVAGLSVQGAVEKVYCVREGETVSWVDEPGTEYSITHWANLPNIEGVE